MALWDSTVWSLLFSRQICAPTGVPGTATRVTLCFAASQR